MKSIAKADAICRSLKDLLALRGFTVAESRNSDGWKKLTLNTDEASILIYAVDAVSKDVFGSNLVAFAPHKLEFASRNDAMSTLVVAKIMAEIAKLGIAMVVKTHATVLATAEAAVGDEVDADLQYPAKGI